MSLVVNVNWQVESGYCLLVMKESMLRVLHTIKFTEQRTGPKNDNILYAGEVCLSVHRPINAEYIMVELILKIEM